MTGGGTAGHVTPNLALIPKLKEKGFQIKYIGSKDGIEKEIITKENIEIEVEANAIIEDLPLEIDLSIDHTEKTIKMEEHE